MDSRCLPETQIFRLGSLLDNAPNYLFEGIVQKRWVLIYTNPSLYYNTRCWQCAAVDGRKCPEDATLVSSLSHDSCITWRNGNNTVLLQNLVRFSEECTTSKVDFWSKFIDLYYQGTVGQKI